MEALPPEELSEENGILAFFEQNGHWKNKHAPRTWGVEEPDLLKNEELRKFLEQCIRKLPAPWAIVFNMKYHDDENSEHICKELGLSTSNYWVIIHRAKLSLRSCLEKNWLNR